MRFKLCGDLEVPEWLLKEVIVVAKLPNLRVKILSGMVVKRILGQGIDFGKVAKMTSAAELDASDVKALLAALTYIITNGVKYGVATEVLHNELQQLGLPKEHCDVITKSIATSKDALEEHFREETFTLPALDSIDWRVDYVMSSCDAETIEHPQVQLCLGVLEADKEEAKKYAFELGADKFRVLVEELTRAKAIMEAV